MTEGRGEELKNSVAALCARLGIQGHLLVYLDGDKVRFTGDLSVQALTPYLLNMLASRIKV